jgi:hypothetical protein
MFKYKYYKRIKMLGRILKSNYKFFSQNFPKKCFSEVYGNCIKFSETFNSNEIKIPLKDKTNVVYFNNNEDLASLKNKIKGLDKEFVQKLEVRPFDDKKDYPHNTKVEDILSKPFEILINNHLTLKHFPSLNLVITSSLNSHQNVNINDPHNHYLYLRSLQELAKKKDTSQEAIKAELTKLYNIYENLHKEYIKGEETVTKLLNKRRKQFMTLSILYFIGHLIAFYVLIYHISAWDTIEPYTYIVGNVYWIVALAFFIVMMRKLDMSFVYSSTFTQYFLNKYRFFYGCNPLENSFYLREMNKINKFIYSIRKI